MFSLRFRATLSTVFLVVGALLVGDALHGSVVTGQYGVTSPAAVFRAVGGGLAILVGYRLQTPVDEYVATPSSADPERGDEGEGAAAEGSFDPELSPVGETIEGAERDDGDENRPE